MQRAEVITVERRRRWSAIAKQQIVAEAATPGGSVSAVARRYGLHPSQVFLWRKAERNGGSAVAPASAHLAGSGFVPVVVTEPVVSGSDRGRMEIVLGNGRSIVVDAGVDAAALARVIAVVDWR
jgi:transposase